MPRYHVTIDRCCVKSQVVEIIADNEDAAAEVALDTAGDIDFTDGYCAMPEYSIADGGIVLLDPPDYGLTPISCPKELIRKLLFYAEDILGDDAEDSPTFHQFVKSAEALGIDTTPDWKL